jgi:predicted glycosyltransferase/peptidoglycan/xylan/chitin deacetylase (PgdA/CDA1 family)
VRLLIAVTHLLGAGHLTRATALARAFTAAGHETLLVSGGRPAPMVRQDGLQVVQLPPLHVVGTAFSRPLGPDGAPADAAFLALRCARLTEAAGTFGPDVVITELFPFGRRALSAEFLALVEAARIRVPRPLVLASVRDILAASARPERIAEAHARVAALYDAVLVHADPALVPLDASWPLDADTARRVRYTGYVDEGAPAPVAGARSGILVAAGSGPAGIGLLRAAAEAAGRRPDDAWRILAGHGVPDATLKDIGAGLPAGILGRARPDYRSLLAGAALSVSQSGYNTAVDLLATGTPAVLVPFEAGGETEQRLRADRLAARGLARVLPEAELTGETLLRAVDIQRAAPRAAPHGFDLGGAARTVAIVEALLARRRAVPRRGAPRSAGFDLLRRALDGAAACGQRVPLFWRDDDATAASPALDRLIDLADAHAAPLLVAAIPADLMPSLGERLATAPGVTAAVHGFAHRNHAPPAAKAAEFGDHRPLADAAADAAAGLRIARERLPPSALLPIFVPPWNRISADVAAILPDLGYRGLSAVPGPDVPGLVRIDATLDPIDWRGTRSLRDPDAMLRDLAAGIARDPRRPVGLLTHHRVHDAAVWAFLEVLLKILAAHPATEKLDLRKVFADAEMDSGPAGSKSSLSPIARIG